jgi:hypothetical protein
MPLPVQTRLLQAVLDQVDDLTYVKHFGQIAEQLDALNTDEYEAFLQSMKSNTPAIFVTLDEFSGFGRGTIDGTQWAGNAQVHVYALSDYRGSLVEGRLNPSPVAQLDTTKDPGIRQMAEDLFVRLAGFGPIDESGRLNPSTGRYAATAKGVTVWGWTFNVELYLTSAPYPAPDEYQDLRVQITPPPPDEDAIIAEEDLSL